MRFEVARVGYTHPDEKQKVAPRDKGICEVEFGRWLMKQRQLCRWNDAASEAIKEVTRMYVLSRQGLLGVTCFCGQLAEGIGYTITARTPEAVGLCNSHLKEYQKAEEIQTALRTAVTERFKS